MKSDKDYKVSLYSVYSKFFKFDMNSIQFSLNLTLRRELLREFYILGMLEN
jgi:hypothetical protein